MHELCSGEAANRTRQRARSQSKTQILCTTCRRFPCLFARRQRPQQLRSSGYVRNFARRAWRMAAPAVCMPSRRGSPFAVQGNTTAVPTCECDLFSRRHAVGYDILAGGRDIEVASISGQTRAASCFGGADLACKTPERGPAAR